MFENVNIRSSVAVYVQIENTVLFAVASGRLKEGDQLPSVREVSEKLNINPNTVAKSYRDLEVMGIVFTRRGMGVYINKGVEAKCRELCRSKIIGRLHEVVTEAKAAGMTVQEIKTLCAASCSTDSELYGDTPASLLALAKGKKN
ncbi:MAG TPA: GntR family transcriptional regulator [Candidatus Hydrogenedentes bacterium]|nr:GntR family transcriptional regulator [Candidatus Hydrogenedentota bacterium]HPC16586.1 GntR family transcriptional regulator [Candidatus Hydrogenedentota bacterium]HRT20914.1 GntR family transcriptional regulator [Candidatus Hydrogenedentota bacterium]HRT63437.1 GntR family transcriptional regulator [Candidatus Hydrogenedentota bacterium]